MPYQSPFKQDCASFPLDRKLSADSESVSVPFWDCVIPKTPYPQPTVHTARASSSSGSSHRLRTPFQFDPTVIYPDASPETPPPYGRPAQGEDVTLMATPCAPCARPCSPEPPPAAMRAVERDRGAQRRTNGFVTQLSESLTALSLPDMTDKVSYDVPPNGAGIRAITHPTINTLLYLYEVPSAPTMTLHEKKEAYLRFIGAGRALMRLVLD